MIQVTKEKNYMGSLDIRLKINENITLDIVFGGVGDVYWIYDNQNFFDAKEDPMYDKLLITKEDIDIYNIFNELYEDLCIAYRDYLTDRTYDPIEHYKKYREIDFEPMFELIKSKEKEMEKEEIEV